MLYIVLMYFINFFVFLNCRISYRLCVKFNKNVILIQRIGGMNYLHRVCAFHFETKSMIFKLKFYILAS